MKIIFFTVEDPFYVKIFFDEFFKNFKSLNEIKSIVISRPMGKKSILKLACQMYDFYGAFNFLLMGFRYTYVKLMGRKSIQRSDSGPIPKTYTIKQLSRAYGLNVIERSDLNNKSFIEYIEQFDADLFISVASPIIFKEQLINIPKLDCINIHNASLPEYRGMLPSFWQLYHGEKEAGITIHKIRKGIDTGEIILQRHVPIDHDETLHSLMQKSKTEGAKLMKEVIEGFRNNSILYRRMEGKGSYFTFPVRKDVSKFKGRGRRLL